LEEGAKPVLHSECNAQGLQPGRCPEGFFCGKTIVEESFLFMREIRVCEPLASPPHLFAFDVPDSDWSTTGVEVTLRFTLNDEAWPTSRADANGGMLKIWPRGNASSPEEWALPSGEEGPLHILLAPGEYSVQAIMSGDDVDHTAYPVADRMGRLVVKSAGEAVVPFEGYPVHYSISVDGEPMEALPESVLWLIVHFTADRSLPSGLTFRPQEKPEERILLPPGSYDVQVQVISTATLPLPTGSQLVYEGLLIGPGEDPDVTFDLSLVPVSGEVRLNGEELPGGAQAGAVIYSSVDALHLLGGMAGLAGVFPEALPAGLMTISSQRPADYEGSVYAGRYDVHYDGTDSELPGVPPCRFPVVLDVEAGGVLDVNLETVAVSGSLRLNGHNPGQDGMPVVESIRFTGHDWVDYCFSTFDLDDAQPPEFSGLLFAGIYNIHLAGYGDGNSLVRLVSEVEVSPSPLDLDIAVHKLEVDLTLNGEAPPSCPDDSCSSRGSVFVESLDFQDFSQAIHTFIEPEGALSATVLVPSGSWRMGYASFEEDSPLPPGSAHLADLQVDGDRSLVYDLRTVDVEVSLTRAGKPWPHAPNGGAPGVIRFRPRMGFNSSSLVLPADGEARVSGVVYRGIHDIYYSCDIPPDQECLDEGAFSHLSLAKAVLIE